MNPFLQKRKYAQAEPDVEDVVEPIELTAEDIAAWQAAQKKAPLVGPPSNLATPQFDNEAALEEELASLNQPSEEGMEASDVQEVGVEEDPQVTPTHTASGFPIDEIEGVKEVSFLDKLKKYAGETFNDDIDLFKGIDPVSVKQYGEILQKQNLAPWAAVIDNWQGGKLADVFKSQGKSDSDLEETLLKAGLIEKRMGKRQDYELGRDFSKEVSKSIDPWYKVAVGFPLVRSALQVGPDGKVSLERVNQILGTLIKQGGAVGAQTEEDVKRTWLPFIQKRWAELKNLVGEGDRIDPKYIKNIEGFIDASEEAWKEITKRRLNIVGNRYKIRGLSPELADQEIAATLQMFGSSGAKDDSLEISPKKPSKASGKKKETASDKMKNL